LHGATSAAKQVLLGHISDRQCRFMLGRNRRFAAQGYAFARQVPPAYASDQMVFARSRTKRDSFTTTFVCLEMGAARPKPAALWALGW
jgi:hypothetical protein